MNNPKYNIGDELWWAKTESTTKYVKCPDCFGKRFLTVILGDNSKVTIPCASCSGGFNPPTGSISYYSYKESITKIKIVGLKIKEDEEIEYQARAGENSYWIIKEKDLFDTKTGAQKRAKDLAKEHSEKAFKKLQGKEKPTRTWASNVSWYRSRIRDAKETIARYEKKLEYAKYLKED